ncbi:hypothetical protein MSG28_003365 [Choristoneura fumiferana]|uniref:Uncharacterized protein n=1 Tax=Choristoneura fumiferana TaxID=7141 RepID=A0ACC0KEL1_CHOFU|nr:hypothetical protein MSG28_003365 [Choristoneura fumiferana]
MEGFNGELVRSAGMTEKVLYPDGRSSKNKWNGNVNYGIHDKTNLETFRIDGVNSYLCQIHEMLELWKASLALVSKGFNGELVRSAGMTEKVLYPELGERGELTVGVRSRSRGRRLRCCHVYVLSMCVQAIDSHCGLRWRYAELGAALRRVKPGPLEVNELFILVPELETASIVRVTMLHNPRADCRRPAPRRPCPSAVSKQSGVYPRLARTDRVASRLRATLRCTRCSYYFRDGYCAEADSRILAPRREVRSRAEAATAAVRIARQSAPEVDRRFAPIKRFVCSSSVR